MVTRKKNNQTKGKVYTKKLRQKGVSKNYGKNRKSGKTQKGGRNWRKKKSLSKKKQKMEQVGGMELDEVSNDPDPMPPPAMPPAAMPVAVAAAAAPGHTMSGFAGFSFGAPPAGFGGAAARMPAAATPPDAGAGAGAAGGKRRVQDIELFPLDKKGKDFLIEDLKSQLVPDGVGFITNLFENLSKNDFEYLLNTIRRSDANVAQVAASIYGWCEFVLNSGLDAGADALDIALRKDPNRLFNLAQLSKNDEIKQTEQITALTECIRTFLSTDPTFSESIIRNLVNQNMFPRTTANNYRIRTTDKIGHTGIELKIAGNEEVVNFSFGIAPLDVFAEEAQASMLLIIPEGNKEPGVDLSKHSKRVEHFIKLLNNNLFVQFLNEKLTPKFIIALDGLYNRNESTQDQQNPLYEQDKFFYDLYLALKARLIVKKLEDRKYISDSDIIKFPNSEAGRKTTEDVHIFNNRMLTTDVSVHITGINFQLIFGILFLEIQSSRDLLDQDKYKDVMIRLSKLFKNKKVCEGFSISQDIMSMGGGGQKRRKADAGAAHVEEPEKFQTNKFGCIPDKHFEFLFNQDYDVAHIHFREWFEASVADPFKLSLFNSLGLFSQLQYNLINNDKYYCIICCRERDITNNEPQVEHLWGTFAAALARILHFPWIYCLICGPCNLITPRAKQYSGRSFPFWFPYFKKDEATGKVHLKFNNLERSSAENKPFGLTDNKKHTWCQEIYHTMCFLLCNYLSFRKQKGPDAFAEYFIKKYVQSQSGPVKSAVADMTGLQKGTNPEKIKTTIVASLYSQTPESIRNEFITFVSGGKPIQQLSNPWIQRRSLETQTGEDKNLLSNESQNAARALQKHFNNQATKNNDQSSPISVRFKYLNELIQQKNKALAYLSKERDRQFKAEKRILELEAKLESGAGNMNV